MVSVFREEKPYSVRNTFEIFEIMFTVLGIEPRASFMLSKLSTTELSVSIVPALTVIEQSGRIFAMIMLSLPEQLMFQTRTQDFLIVECMGTVDGFRSSHLKEGSFGVKYELLCPLRGAATQLYLIFPWKSHR